MGVLKKHILGNPLQAVRAHPALSVPQVNEGLSPTLPLNDGARRRDASGLPPL